jgi:hypothetical protein
MARTPDTRARACRHCGAPLVGKRRDAQYCTDGCRNASWYRTPRQRLQRLVSPQTEPETPAGNGTAKARRRPSRDGRGVRLYVLPEDDEAQILAKVRAARGGAISPR